MISPSCPEPARDIAAQLAALRDPLHPKDAVWIAAGTRFAASALGQAPFMVARDEGILLTTIGSKARLLRDKPDDASLALILGYLEAKWAVARDWLVVRALDREGCVVLEQAVSADRLIEAQERAKPYGDVELTCIAAVLERRRAMCAAERQAT